MNTSVWKPFWDYEKEEAWLNTMSAKGLALTRYTWMHYIFEDTDPGEYIYRIEMLAQRPDKPESVRYLDFLKDSGIEVVSTYLDWVYLRKKAIDGPFDLYSDIDSRLAHATRVSNMWLALACSVSAIALSQIPLATAAYQAGSRVWWLNIVGLVVCLVIAIGFVGLWLRHHRRAAKLQRDRKVQE